MSSVEKDRAIELTDENCILHRLKTDTLTHHHSIEHAIPVMRSDLSRNMYLDILKRFYGFYSALEADFANHPALRTLVPDLEERRKLSLLELDLKHLGVSSKQMKALPAPNDKPLGHNLYEALGCLYVMEGSTLGGQLISKHVKDLLGFKAGEGASYYNAYGPNTGKMWQAFKRFLKTHIETETQKYHAIEGAKETFRKLQEWMG